jgi:geranylgeranyl diphosphate synthase type 3
MSQQPLHEPPPHLLQPYHYISSTPGKNIRSALIDCFQLWLQVPPSKTANDASDKDNVTDILSEIKSIIASLHNASLLIDDIEDNSKLRRGNPVAHSIFGVANCINCANYVYFLAMERCQRLGSEEALKVDICIVVFYAHVHMI